MNSQILLTISILISNRPDTVRKCLDSIKPLLDNVPSELILVDTGCGEQVRGMIEEYTDKIVDFEWCKDFSKARNAGLKKARGEWFLFLDDDEWFEDVTELIDFFRSGEYREYGLAVYTQRNYLEADGSVYTDLLVGRMTKLSPDTRFVYRIHECFNRVKGRTKRFNAYVHHYGYVYASEKESLAHSMRNISLLLEEHAEDPGNMKHTLQLAQEYNVLGEYSKSLEMSLEGIALSDEGKLSNSYFLSSLFANEIGCYMDTYRYDDTIEKGEQYLKDKRPDKMVKAMIAGHLAVAYTERKDHEKVLKYAEYYWDSYQDYRKDEESFMGFVTTITNKCFEEHNRSIVLGKGICAAVRLGKGERAWQWFDSFDWEEPQIFVNNEMIRTVAERMPDAGHRSERPYYVKMCNTMMARADLEIHVLRAISDCCKSKESLEERVAALASYEGVQSGHWFFKLRDIVVRAFLPEEGAGSGRAAAGNKEAACGSGESGVRPETGKDVADVERLAADVWENPDVSMSLIRTYSMLEAVERLGGDNGRILTGIPFYLWKKGITAYFEQFSWEDADWWNGQLAAALPREDAHMLVWSGLYSLAGAVRAAGCLGQDAVSEAAITTIREPLEEYVHSWKTLCEKIYRTEVIAQAKDMLPEEYQGVYLISDMLAQAREGKYGEAVNAIRELRKRMPGLTGLMKPYVRWIDDQMKRQAQEARQAAGEFQVLARQIKARIRGLMDAGEYQAALGVAKQLQALLPEDEEIRRLIEQLA